MRIEELLRDDAPAIVNEVAPAVARLEHYGRDGEQATRRRVEALYRHVADAVRTRDLGALRRHVGRLAQERFQAGYGFGEVQAAFAAIEDAIWRHALARLPSEEAAWGLALVGTAMTHGKDALGRTFARLAPTGHAPTVDLTPLFARAEPAAEGFREELVYPV